MFREAYLYLEVLHPLSKASLRCMFNTLQEQFMFLLSANPEGAFRQVCLCLTLPVREHPC